MANNGNDGGSHSIGWFLGGLGAGLALGLTIGILFAPRSGVETRRILREHLDESAENFLDRLDAFMAAARKKLDHIVKRLGVDQESPEGSEPA